MKEYLLYITIAILFAITIKPILKKLEYRLRKKKGENYEKKVAEHFIKNGYEIIMHGIEKNKKDLGVDLIAKKENEIYLIQCKDWRENSKFKITHKELKEFIGNTIIFLEHNQEYQKLNPKRLFVTSGDILDKSANNLLKFNKNILEHNII